VQSLGVVESKAEHQMRFEPDHPLANEEGYVFQSNVNNIEEMANMISASRSYQTNVEVLNTSKQLLLQTLKLGQ
jgi:flagellar basal-body rod protein FlgC